MSLLTFRVWKTIGGRKAQHSPFLKYEEEKKKKNPRTEEIKRGKLTKHEVHICQVPEQQIPPKHQATVRGPAALTCCLILRDAVNFFL